MSTFPPPDAADSTATYTSNGRPVRVERFEPEGRTAGAVVFLLHGADGLRYRAPTYRAIARDLARAGYVALLPHYFDATGPAPGVFAINPVQFLAWMQAVADGMTYAAREYPVGARRIGLLGFSLGAYLSLSVAGQDARVGAVVDCFGGLPDLFAEAAAHLPPTLILHGEADPVVPVSEARKLEQMLKAYGRPYTMHLYPGQGHTFDGRTLRDALDRVLAFLAEHLPAKADDALAS